SRLRTVVGRSLFNLARCLAGNQPSGPLREEGGGDIPLVADAGHVIKDPKTRIRQMNESLIRRLLAEERIIDLKTRSGGERFVHLLGKDKTSENCSIGTDVFSEAPGRTTAIAHDIRRTYDAGR
ncbi:unnamed protein product, partial [Pleuronectes platessa]